MIGLSTLTSLMPYQKRTRGPSRREQEAEAYLAQLEASARGAKRPKRAMREHIRTGHFDGIAGRAWFLPYHDGITAETAAMRAAYPTMLRSPCVKSALMGKVLNVAASDWDIQPDNPENPVDQEAAEFLHFNVDRLPEGFAGAVTGMMLAMLIDGNQITEPILEVETEDTKWRNSIVLGNLKPRHRDTYDLEIDAHLNVVGVCGRGPNQGEVWPIGDFVYSRYLPVYDDPKGTSDLRAAYTAYWFRDTVSKLRALNAERSTGGILVGTYADDDDKTDADAAMQQAKANTWMTIPEGVKVEALQLASKGEQDWKSFIDDCDKQIFIGITGAYLQVLEGAANAERGNASVSKSVSELFPWLLSTIVQNIFNRQVFPLLLRYSKYRGIRCPKLILGGVSEEEVTKIIANATGLQAMGFNIDAQDLSRRTGYQQAATPEAGLKKPVAPAPTWGGGGFGAPQFVDGGKKKESFGELVVEMTDEEWEQFCQEGVNKGKPGPCPGPKKEKTPKDNKKPQEPATPPASQPSESASKQPEKASSAREFKSEAEISEWSKQNYSGWANELPPDSKSAIKSYAGEGYKQTNGWLRQGGDASAPSQLGHQVRAIDAAIEKSVVPEDIRVFRGLKTIPPGLKEGAVFHNHGFVSTSLSKDSADGFVGDAVMNIRIRKGAKGAMIDSLSGYDEHELLLPRSSKFKVISVAKEKGNRTIFNVELVQ